MNTPSLETSRIGKNKPMYALLLPYFNLYEIFFTKDHH